MSELSTALRIPASFSPRVSGTAFLGEIAVLRPSAVYPGSNRQPPTEALVARTEAQGIRDRVFSRIVNLKVVFSQFAMHVSDAVRSKYFKRIDEIVDCDEWDERDLLPDVESYQDFLRCLILYRYPWLPELALNSDGVFAACWYSSDFRATIEFPGRRRIRWIVSRNADDEPEYAGGACAFDRMVEVLRPHVHGRGIFA